MLKSWWRDVQENGHSNKTNFKGSVLHLFFLLQQGAVSCQGTSDWWLIDPVCRNDRLKLPLIPLVNLPKSIWRPGELYEKEVGQERCGSGPPSCCFIFFFENILYQSLWLIMMPIAFFCFHLDRSMTTSESEGCWLRIFFFPWSFPCLLSAIVIFTTPHFKPTWINLCYSKHLRRFFSFLFLESSIFRWDLYNVSQGKSYHGSFVVVYGFPCVCVCVCVCKVVSCVRAVPW